MKCHLPTAGLLCCLAAGICSAALADPTGEDKARLEAVVAFANNALDKGRDHYGERNTPLFVDGINVDTFEPVHWVYKRNQWIPSNLASQQNLFRTLTGLTNLTGDPRYKQAALDAIAYHFEHLRSPCGLLRWGGHRFVDLRTEEVVGEQNSHELKFSLPYYELMWELDPAATEKFLKAFWNAHVLDWATLDMNRHGRYNKEMSSLWRHEFTDPRPFFEGEGLTFINCGSDLIYAGAMLYTFTADDGALTWAKRLARQYVRARHPKTGLGVYQYSKAARHHQPPETGPLPTTSDYGDRAENQFAAEFGDVAREGYMLRSPESIYGNNALMQLQLAGMLGEKGKEFLDWTRQGLLAYAHYGYDPDTNLCRPMWADGTDLTGYTIKRSGYYGKAGTVFKAEPAPPMMLWSYTLACRLTGDAELWKTARSMARGRGLGDFGSAPGVNVDVNLATDNADPLALYALLELCRMSDAPAYRNLARRLADNIVRQKFHHGFFLPDANHVNARLDAVEPLSILALEAMLRGKPEAVPRYTGGRAYIHGPHDGLGRTTDDRAIYSKLRKP